MPTEPADVAEEKDRLRRQLLAARRARPAAERAGAAAANTAHLLAALRESGVVCAFLPLPTEPLTAHVLDRLVDAGSTVLVPVVRPREPLDWCTYPAPTRPGAFGIAEPGGPRLGPAAVRDADALLVPALAVDPAGRRLGRGGGHYDRSLALLDAVAGPARPAAHPRPPAGRRVIAVLYDDELLAAVPADVHDRTVSAIVTPATGVLDLTG